MVNDKLKSVPLTKEERKLATLKAQAAKEVIFKLLVKIISWESEALDSVAIKAVNKITPQEWLKYKKHQMSISTYESLQKTKDKLAKTYQAIKDHGGFS